MLRGGGGGGGGGGGEGDYEEDDDGGNDGIGDGDFKLIAFRSAAANRALHPPLPGDRQQQAPRVHCQSQQHRHRPASSCRAEHEAAERPARFCVHSPVHAYRVSESSPPIRRALVRYCVYEATVSCFCMDETYYYYYYYYYYLLLLLLLQGYCLTLPRFFFDSDQDRIENIYFTKFSSKIGQIDYSQAIAIVVDSWYF